MMTRKLAGDRQQEMNNNDNQQIRDPGNMDKQQELPGHILGKDIGIHGKIP